MCCCSIVQIIITVSLLLSNSTTMTLYQGYIQSTPRWQVATGFEAAELRARLRGE